MRSRSKTNQVVYFENDMAWHKPKQIPHLVWLVNLICWLIKPTTTPCLFLTGWVIIIITYLFWEPMTENEQKPKRKQLHDYFHSHLIPTLIIFVVFVLWECTSNLFSFPALIAVITVVPPGKPYFVYRYLKTTWMGHCDGSDPLGLFMCQNGS